MSRRKALPFTCLTSLSVRVLFLAAISPACFFLPRLPLCRSCFSFIFQPLICGALKNIQFLTAEMFSSKSVWFFCVGLCSNNNNIFVFFFPLFFSTSHLSNPRPFALSCHLPIISSSVCWTSNRIHLPWRGGRSPASCSWSLSEPLCLTAHKWAWPLVNRTSAETHTDPPRNHQWSVVVTSVVTQHLRCPGCSHRHRPVSHPWPKWCLISDCLTLSPSTVSPLTSKGVKK